MPCQKPVTRAASLQRVRRRRAGPCLRGPREPLGVSSRPHRQQLLGARSITANDVDRQRSRTRHSGRTRPAATIADDAGLCKRCFVPAAAGCATCWLLHGVRRLHTGHYMYDVAASCLLYIGLCTSHAYVCLGRARPVDFRVDFKFRSAIYAQARPSISIPDGMRVRVRADRVRPTSQFQSSASAGL